MKYAAKTLVKELTSTVNYVQNLYSLTIWKPKLKEDIE